MPERSISPCSIPASLGGPHTVPAGGFQQQNLSHSSLWGCSVCLSLMTAEPPSCNCSSHGPLVSTVILACSSISDGLVQFPSFKLLVWGKKRGASQSSPRHHLAPVQLSAGTISTGGSGTSGHQPFSAERVFRQGVPPISFSNHCHFAGCHLITFRVYIFIYINNNRACCKA